MDTHLLDQVLQECSRIVIPSKKYNESLVSELILSSQFAKSKSEARRLMASRAVKINDEHVVEDVLARRDWLLVRVCLMCREESTSC